MAISYSRDYNLILDDLSRAIATIPKFYEAFEMDRASWTALDEEDKNICLRTLADDVFYVLGGSAASTAVSSGTAEYDPGHGIIKITADPGLIHVVTLRG